MNNVSAVQGNEACIGSSHRYFLELSLCRKPAIPTPDQERGATGRKPIRPMVAIESALRLEHFARFESKPPSVRGRAK
jgi:hypothetical protein